MSAGLRQSWRRLWLGGGSRLLSLALAWASRPGALRRGLHLRTVADAAAAHRVLFVCHGNINRSAYAAALARRDWPGVEVAEAGHDAIAGAPTGELGREAALAGDVDLGTHRANPLSPAALADADLVFVFDARNYLAVAARGRGARRRLRLVGALASSGPLEIADPHGGPPASYEESLRQIDRAIGGFRNLGSGL